MHTTEWIGINVGRRGAVRVRDARQFAHDTVQQPRCRRQQGIDFRIGDIQLHVIVNVGTKWLMERLWSIGVIVVVGVATLLLQPARVESRPPIAVTKDVYAMLEHMERVLVLAPNRSLCLLSCLALWAHRDFCSVESNFALTLLRRKRQLYLQHFTGESTSRYNRWKERLNAAQKPCGPRKPNYCTTTGR